MEFQIIDNDSDVQENFSNDFLFNDISFYSDLQITDTIEKDFDLYNVKEFLVQDLLKFYELKYKFTNKISFVLVYFSYKREVLGKIQLLFDRYKKNNSGCVFIGCGDDREDWTDFVPLSEEHNQIKDLFDLYSEYTTEDDFNSLLRGCLLCGSGIVHMDSNDFFFLQDGVNNKINIFTSKNNSLDEAENELIKKMLMVKYINHEYTPKSFLILFFTNNKEIKLKELQSFSNRIFETFNKNADIMWNADDLCIDLQKNEIKILLICNG